MRRARSKRTGAAGFTLIEVLVAVAIVAILAGIAYPSYLESVRKARRAEVRAALLQLMQQQERYYTQRNTYIAFSSASTDVDERRFKWFSGATPADSGFQIRGRACGNAPLSACIELFAEAGGANVNTSYRDSACPSLSLRSTGEQGGSAACWR